MRGDALDRKARLRQLTVKLRADCIYYGANPSEVRRLNAWELIDLRGRLAKQLMEEAPTGVQCA